MSTHTIAKQTPALQVYTHHDQANLHSKSTHTITKQTLTLQVYTHYNQANTYITSLHTHHNQASLHYKSTHSLVFIYNMNGLTMDHSG